MNPVSEPKILRLGAIAVDVEHVRVGECLWIAVRRGAAQEHRLARRNHTATDPNLFEGVADVVLDRPFVAQQFFDRRRDLAAVVEELLPLFGVAGEGDGRGAEQLGDGLGAGAA